MTPEQHWQEWRRQNAADNIVAHAQYVLEKSSKLSTSAKAIKAFLKLPKNRTPADRVYVSAHLPKLDPHEGYLIRFSNAWAPYKPPEIRMTT